MDLNVSGSVYVAILITFHNRKHKTLGCLDRLFAQSDLQNMTLSVFLTDDGSSDGTAAAVASLF